MSTATTDTGELRIYGELVSELGDVPSDVRTVAEQVLREAKAAVEWTGPASGPGAEESAAEGPTQDPTAQRPHTDQERQGRQRQSPAQDGAQGQPGLRRGPQQPRALQESQPSALVNSGDTGAQRVQWGQSGPGGQGDQEVQGRRGGQGSQERPGGQGGRGAGEGAAPPAQRPPRQGVPAQQGVPPQQSVPAQQGQPGEPQSLSPRPHQDGPSTASAEDRSQQPGHP